MSYERRYLPIGRGPEDSSLDDISDVTLTSAANGDILMYDGTDWVNIPGTLANLNDTDINSPSAGAVLSWDGSNWINDPYFILGLSAPSDGEILQYSSGAGKWQNVTLDDAVGDSLTGNYYPAALGYGGI